MKYFLTYVLLLMMFSICKSQINSNIKLKIEKIKTLENNFDKGTGNSYYLQDMPEGYPIIGESCSQNYLDCTVAFYDGNFNLIAGYREPNYPGEKIMNIFSDDLDMDGDPEILMCVRMIKPGMVCLNWDPEKKQIHEKWLFSMEGKQEGAFHRGSIAGNFTDHPGKEVCFGSSRGILYLLTSEGKLITAAELDGQTVQRICTCDLDHDGYDEMIISAGRDPGEVIFCQWDPRSLKLKKIWGTNVTLPERSGNNCYEAVFHPHGHPEGGPAIGAVTDRESKVLEGSFLLLDMKGNIVWQRVLPPSEGRAGGCDFKDVTGDSIPELLGRFAYSRSSPEGTGILIYNNKGERLGKYPGVEPPSAGPPIFYLNRNNERKTYCVAENTVYQILNEKQAK